MADNKRQTAGSTSATTGNVVTVAGTGVVGDEKVLCGCPQTGNANIQVEQVLGAEMEQRVVEFAMYVPAPKPDIEQVIDVYVKDLELNTVDVIPDKVIIRGELGVKVMYVADLTDQPVHAFERRHVRFTRDIQIPGTLPGMTAKADVQVEYVDYDFDECEPRKVDITIVLKFWARVVSTADMDVYTLGVVDQVGQSEVMTASTAAQDSAAASTFSNETTSASHFDAFGAHNVLVTGMVPTVGMQPTVSGLATVTGDVVNLRTGPGTNFPVAAKLKKGDVVTIREQAFGWYRVVLADQATIGWVASWLVSVNPNANG